MSMESKLKYLLQEINENTSFFEKRKDKHKKRAYWLKLLSIISSSIVTLLLGLKAVNLNLFSNIALFFAALVTIFNGIEGFFNHRALWYKDTNTLIRLKQLKREIEFLNSGDQEDSISMTLLTQYKDILQEILMDDVRSWSSIHEHQKDEPSNK